MRFTIATPSFRSSRWLKLCIASVADQTVEHEHIVQDACSDDGTLDWLPHDPRVTAVVEKDQGMYDAVNRAFRRARGEFLAYLNCDEQYLPGALEKVVEYFERHPEIDVVFGDVIVVNTQGDYICDRKIVLPQRIHTMVGRALAFFTAAAFYRRRILDEHGLFFDTRYRALGDTEWTLRLIDKKVRMGRLGIFTSVFTETGENLGLNDKSRREAREMEASAPFWARSLRPLIQAHFRLRRWQAGAYSLQPHDYAIYTPDHPDQRKVFHVTAPTFRWVR